MFFIEVRLRLISAKLAINLTPEIIEAFHDFSSHPAFKSKKTPSLKQSPGFLDFQNVFSERDRGYFTATRLQFEMKVPDKHSVELKVEVDAPGRTRDTVLDLRWENELHMLLKQSTAVTDVLISAPDRSNFKTKLL